MGTFIKDFVSMVLAAALGTILGLKAFMATMVLIEMF